MQFTKDQQRVIEARNKNILVSAAAGSGKTAVLVERIIRMVVDEEKPIDIDRLLIVTFTSAAAAEMRERIFSAINNELLKRPESEHLQRQAALIHNAKITTIHSFCLEVIRNYFSEIGLDPGFRIADEGELKLLKKDTMAELLEEAYEEADEDFLHFVETYSRGNHDKALEELIEKVYNFVMSFPMPEEYLKESIVDAEKLSEKKVLESPYMAYLLDYVQNVLKGLEVYLNDAIKLTEMSDGPYMYAETLEKDKVVLEELLEVAGDYRALSEKIGQVKFATLSRKSDDSVSEQKKECVKAIRNDVKDAVKKINEKFFFADFAEIVSNEGYTKRAVNTLFLLVQKFLHKLAETKRDKNIIDFNDMEHYALKILLRMEDGKIMPTKVALDYQNYFAEIIVDEYQDSNLVQEYILEAVSGEQKGRFNRFMVGDVKQSIYRFRLARPELFMEKYESYPTRASECEVIDLSMNFRSRREVLDTTNTVFAKLMDSSFGGITYDEAAALYYGATYYPEEGNYDSELLLIEKPDKDEDDTSKEREARVVAHRINELVGQQLVYDKNTGKTRPATYRDIVILLRSNKGWDEVFKKILTEEMIPCHTESKSGYFDAVEVRNVIEFLKIIDNPVQDIPLFGVMTSVFGGFSDEEMALIKGEGDEEAGESLYHSICWYAKEKDDAIAEKIEKFLEMLNEYRMKARYMPIRQLLQQLFTEFHYVAVVSAMKGGEQRRANVELLLQKASMYEKTSYFGAFHFVRYLQQIMEKEVEYGEADILDENADVVRIMSIHKSKGLEFPICFVAGLGKKINFMDTHQVLVVDSDLGIGSECIHYENRLQSKTLSKNVIVQKMINDSLAEELRILYVAFTRAREKLILSGTLSNPEKKIPSLMKYTNRGKSAFSVQELSTVTSALEYVLMALAKSRGMEKVYKQFDVPVKLSGEDFESSAYVDIQCIFGDGMALYKETKNLQKNYERTVFEEEAALHANEEKVTELHKRLSYEYGHKNLSGLFTKTTVSELKMAALPHDEGANPMFEEEREKTKVPKFMKGEEKVRGTQRGTAFHKVMEVFPFERFAEEYEITKDVVSEILKEQVDNGKLPEEYVSLISVDKILHFMKSSLAKRMIKAAKEGKLYKEQPFVYGIQADELNKEFPATETVLIQGIIDAYFEEDDKIVLLDYKTDVIGSENALVNRYQVQLDYYATVLEKLLSKPVEDIVIYSFYFEKEIKLQKSK